MEIIIVDDEEISREILELMVRTARPNDNIITFNSPFESLEHVKKNRCDVAFLDIIMTEMSGIDLAKAITNISPRTNIIFETTSPDYMSEAFRLYSSGYLLKPLKIEDVVREFAHLRYPIEEKPKFLRVQTFGRFEVFYGDAPIKFSHAKTKELLAYLIDRKGASVDTGTLCAVLWEDKSAEDSAKSYLRILTAELTKKFEAMDLSGAFIKSRNSFAINPDFFDCDLYKYQSGDKSVKELFNYEYMSQYSWAEDTLGSLY